MARRSLRPQLNQIRGWVRQGRTDAWIAHQLDVTVQQIETFKKDNDLSPNGAAESTGPAEFEAEIDLRAEDDALIAAELDAVEAEQDDDEDDGDGKDDDGDAPKRPRRRGRRGGRGRKRAGPVTLEGTFDHGEDGYGLWLDPSVQDDPIYAEHWAGQRLIEVTVEEEQIVIRRSGESAGDDAGSDQ